MFLEFMVWFLLLGKSSSITSQQEDVGFTYNGFRGVNMSLDGLAQITDNGLLMLLNSTTQQVAHAFYPHPIHFRNSSTGNALSFSTTFVFAVRKFLRFGGNGMAFVIAPSKQFPGALPGVYLGLFNSSNIGNSSNHLIAIELDFIQNKEFNDIDGNHVGIDINDLKSVESKSASYFNDEENQHVNLSLIGGQTLQLWVEYYGEEKQLNVTLAPFNVPKPKIPLLSLKIDFSHTIVDPMFVGFSSATYVSPISQYILGWSFKMNGEARELTLSQLPKLPHITHKHRHMPFIVAVFVTGGAILVLFSIFIIRHIVRRKKKFAEVLEDWENEYELHRFKYKDLYIATKGFKDKELLGIGGFGRVYRGVLPTTKIKVAVKRVFHNSSQGEKEFIAEIISIGKLRHRSIVTLLGYCRRKEELLLVYDFMPNGSLDKFIFDQTSNKMLCWYQRFRIIKSVAAALLYLHEEWEHVVIHRDVKSSNILLDKEFNGRLGDFGLAKLYDHGTGPRTTYVVGTPGYLAPELGTTGKASPSVDVYAFGAFLLEVACGRRPIEPEASDQDSVVLVDWVTSCWSRGRILDTVDPKLGMNFEVEEMELVLKLGLLCSHFTAYARPHMRQVMRYLEGEVSLPQMIPPGLTSFVHFKGFSDFSVAESTFSEGDSNPLMSFMPA